MDANNCNYEFLDAGAELKDFCDPAEQRCERKR